MAGQWLTICYTDWDVVKYVGKIVLATLVTYFIVKFVWKRFDVWG